MEFDGVHVLSVRDRRTDERRHKLTNSQNDTLHITKTLRIKIACRLTFYCVTR